jgi:hypothetical protein
MLHLNQKLFSRFALTGVLVFMLVLPIVAKVTIAQTTNNYFVTVNPTKPESLMYTIVGRNWTISFEALWSYGDNSGEAIKNATVTIQVSNSKNDIINTLQLNTTTGIFSFNYSLSTPDKLTFKPTELITQDGAKYNSKLFDAKNSVYGFHSKSVVVWWDTFHVSLVNSSTNTLGTVTVSVNVTYLLLPENGLTLPEWATYSNQTFFPKIVHGANVTINGLKANETSIGIYTANSSIWLSTAYIHVGVSKEGWITKYAGFSFTHTANEPLWEYTAIIGLFSVVALAISFYRKSQSRGLSLSKNVTLGGVLLLITSFISFYWGLVGFEGALHGFNWIFLTLLGLLSFGFGLVGGILSLRRKNQTLVLLLITMQMITNSVAIISSHNMYALANPWLMVIPSFVLSVISGILLSREEEEFT